MMWFREAMKGVNWGVETRGMEHEKGWKREMNEC